MASRYHCLPSEILEKADTFDVYVLQTATAWQEYQQEVSKAKHSGGPMPAANLSQDQMRAMIQRVRSGDGSKKGQ
jgi:hypothetical protein